MRSVRLDQALESRLAQAARLSGEPVSKVIRQAVEARCEAILGQRLADRLRDVTGTVRSNGGRARLTGVAFGAHLAKVGKRGRK